MKAIDGLLNIVSRQEATELRLASDRPPRLFRGADELSLTMPATSAEALHTLVGELVAPHEEALKARGSATFIYLSEAGEYDVRAHRRLDGADLDVRFVRRAPGSAAVKRPPAAPSAAPPATSARAPLPPRTEGSPPLAGRASTSGSPSERGAPQVALPRAVTAVLEHAASIGASDVHLSQLVAPIVRVHGELRILHGVEPPDIAALVADRAQLERVLAGHAADIGLDVPGVGRLRMNVYTSADGLSAAIRLLAREAPRLSELSLPPVLQSLVQLPHGLVIACGPTGSGKSTTLAALAQEAMRVRARVLITLEDPLEYRIRPGADGGLVRQREIGRHASSFADGLRDALREDPDIILVGEMRDTETIGLALTAAETGHLVFASLHTRSSASAIERIVDTYAPERQRQIRVQLADALRAVILQRLLPRADGGGRVPVVEFLRVTPGVANLIREGKTPQIVSAVQSGGEEGMVPLERSLADLVRGEIVTLETARSVATDPKYLDDYLGMRR